MTCLMSDILVASCVTLSPLISDSLLANSAKNKPLKLCLCQQNMKFYNGFTLLASALHCVFDGMTPVRRTGKPHLKVKILLKHGVFHVSCVCRMLKWILTIQNGFQVVLCLVCMFADVQRRVYLLDFLMKFSDRFSP